MKRLKGGRGEKRKGVEVDQLLRGKGRRSRERERERSIPRRGNGMHRSGEKTTTAVALLYFLAAIIERGISKVKIKIKMRCRG